MNCNRLLSQINKHLDKFEEKDKEFTQRYTQFIGEIDELIANSKEKILGAENKISFLKKRNMFPSRLEAEDKAIDALIWKQKTESLGIVVDILAARNQGCLKFKK